MTEPRLRWVASSPVARPAPRAAAPPSYAGPPAYAEIPQWGLPRVIWRRPRQLGPLAPGNAERMRALAGSVVPALWLVAGIAVVAAGAELWRYTILLASRFDAVAARALRMSDALVVLAGVVLLLFGAVATMLAVFWLVRAYAAAAERAGVTPARPAWQVVAAVLVPVVNLVSPAAVLAELEHAGMGRGPDRRPRPSRTVLLWWALWAVGLLAVAITVAWSFRGSVQAQANGVLLHAGTDLIAAVVAGVTAVLVRRYTALLEPGRPHRARRMIVSSIGR